MVSRIVLILAVVAAAGLLAGCGAGGTSSGGRETVVAAFYPLAYAAELVGGSSVAVDNLVPAGGEPHDLELTAGAVGDIQRADVVLYLGHGFQPALSEAVKGARGRTVDLLAGLPLRPSDPHVWLDPVLYARIVKRVAGVLGRPARATAPLARLRALDREYRRGLAHCARTEIVTSHEAFGYLAQRYGLRQVAITGITPESEPSARQLGHVVSVVRRTHATTVFFEKLVSPRLAETVARETGERTAVLDPIEGLTPSEQAHEDTYFTLMRQNLGALRKALLCR
jgi:zinc transport system substrate-binding protein